MYPEALTSHRKSPAAAEDPESPPPAWYVVHTRSRHETKVERGLREKGLMVFLPRLIVPSRRRDRRVLLEPPLFPGYLFIRCALGPTAYLEVIKTQGVVRILGQKEGCAPVPEATIRAIETAVASQRPYQPWRFLNKGRWVRIIDGPLAGICGIIVELKEKKRKLVVSVELFRRALAVELADEAVEPWPGP